MRLRKPIEPVVIEGLEERYFTHRNDNTLILQFAGKKSETATRCKVLRVGQSKLTKDQVSSFKTAYLIEVPYAELPV